MIDFLELFKELEDRGYDPSALLDYLQRELAPAITPDEECMIDPDTNEPYTGYDWGTYQ